MADVRSGTRDVPTKTTEITVTADRRTEMTEDVRTAPDPVTESAWTEQGWVRGMCVLTEHVQVTEYVLTEAV